MTDVQPEESGPSDSRNMQMVLIVLVCIAIILLAVLLIVQLTDDSGSGDAESTQSDSAAMSAESTTSSTTAAPTSTSTVAPTSTATPTTTPTTTTTTTTTSTTTTTTTTTTLPPALGPLDCQNITAGSVLAPDPMLNAAGNATRAALFAAAMAEDTVALEAVYPGYDVVLGHMRVSETWAEAMVEKADLTQEIIRSLCEGADASGFSPGWCLAAHQGLSNLTADQLAQVNQRANDYGKSINDEIFGDFACFGSPTVIITIDSGGPVTYLGIGLT